MSEKPLYLQLADTLAQKIKELFSPNDKLLSERELTNQYGVSRMTVRLALQELETRGLIYKKHGKGTFVAETSDSTVDLSASYSFTDHMRNLGKVPKTEILSFSEVKASDYIAKQLNLSQNDMVYEIERLRIADDVPMMVERSYIPKDIFKGLRCERLYEKPLYEIFSDDYSQTIRTAEEEFFASIALDRESKFLKIKSGSPVLHIVRKTFNTKNHIIEFTFSIARADQFRYKITHHKT
ncbi:GntR family transcriptional regulator [Streptococcus sp. CSL10205-OR2]|uniref:GntR family transcriptional regulator n=1 Tax=Streptococcus sp. CSL10205-OR2 TaxID=2980558 RepID=UPI0021DB2985|nr:GntR family transcriptional regulator [Streptococcus sp. CSL10205-OR2]MCU9533418.1 GntR family transcriptional regulator [Streptococcus sp. CSL10205-OR2]